MLFPTGLIIQQQSHLLEIGVMGQFYLPVQGKVWNATAGTATGKDERASIPNREKQQ